MLELGFRAFWEHHVLLCRSPANITADMEHLASGDFPSEEAGDSEKVVAVAVLGDLHDVFACGVCGLTHEETVLHSLQSSGIVNLRSSAMSTLSLPSASRIDNRYVFQCCQILAH